MSEHIVLNPKYESVRPQIESLPIHFGEGTLLYGGRNEIRRFNWSGTVVVAKRFKRMGLIKRIIYTFFRTDKARRSYSNAMEIISRGMHTPEPVACVVTKSGGLMDGLYYVSKETTAKDIKGELIDKEPYNRTLMLAYAKFVATLHEKGILHRDLNPTNVLYEPDGKGGYGFTLIDVNRMTFYNGPVPKAECMENLTLFWWLTPVYRAVLDEYAKQRHWTNDDKQKAIGIKEVHDRRWIRRKKITHLFKHQ